LLGLGLVKGHGALICGRWLVGESATLRGFGWCRMALNRQFRTLFETASGSACRLS
jgi:hypothetical protein